MKLNRANKIRCGLCTVVAGLVLLAGTAPALAQTPSPAQARQWCFDHLRLGNLDAAIADYDAALSAKLELDSALFGRGLAKRKKGDADGAERDIAAAKTINAEIADAFAHYGVQ